MVSTEADLLASTRGLTVRYGATVALENVSVSIRAGQFTALIGPNGSGKSTLLRALLGLVPYSGEVAIHVPRQLVGYVPQRIEVDRGLPATVGGFAAALTGAKPLPLGIGRATRRRVAGMLERTGAAHLQDRPLGGLSGGEMQRVLLALALEPTPRLLFLDEAASGMDVAAESAMYALLRDLVKQHGTGVVMVSHDLSVVSDLTDHVVCINRALVCEGSADDILTAGRIAEVFGHHHGVYVHHHGHDEHHHHHHDGEHKA